MNLRKLQIKNNDRSTQTFIFKNDMSLYDFINHYKRLIFIGMFTYNELQYPTRSVNTILLKDVNFDSIFDGSLNVDCGNLLHIDGIYGNNTDTCEETSCSRCVLNIKKELLIVKDLIKKHEHTKTSII